MSKYLNVITFLVLVGNFYSCSSLFTLQKNATIKASSPDEKIEVYNVVKEDYETIGIGEGNYKLNNQHEHYLFKTSKEDNFYTTTPKRRTRFNVLKLLDVAVPLIADIILINSLNSSSSENNLAGPAWIVGTLGWIGTAFSPWKLYDSQIYLPPSPNNPVPKANAEKLMVSNISLNVSNEDYSTIHYEGLKNFELGKKLFEINHKESLKEKDLNLDEELNYYLSRWGFKDSTSRMLAGFYDAYGLSCEIVGIRNYKVGEMIKSEFTTNWSISRPHQKEIFFKKKVTSISQWEPYKSGNGFPIAFESALISNLKEAIQDKEIMAKLDSVLLIESINIVDNYEPIVIDKPVKNISNIEEAVKAVVTIQTDNGHGSGCLISNQGYIITNHHVISDSSKINQVILNTGEKINFKVIRYSSEFDLALLKIDSILPIIPFYIDTTIVTGLGKEVFAIGTPGDIVLGQTLSKGIVSGNRMFNKKKYIQTDVPINGGNSGGALIDYNGNLLGIVNAKIVGYGVEGIGFAIPVSAINLSLRIDYK